MRVSDIWNAKVKTLDGEYLGRVHDIHCDGGKIVAIACGPGGVIERLTARKHGRRVPWDCVRKIAEGEILVTPDPPQRIVSASRIRRGTRRPSARRSRR